MALQKFVVLIVVLFMLAGLTVYVVLDSDVLKEAQETYNQTVNETSNTINDK